MKKGYNYLLISFACTIFTGLFSKIGATTLDKFLFMFILYSIGSLFAFFEYKRKESKINRKIKKTSIKFGIILGIINFLSYFTLLSALAIGPGALIFPIEGLTIAFITVLSMLFFKERLNWKGYLGFILALMALMLLS